MPLEITDTAPSTSSTAVAPGSVKVPPTSRVIGFAPFELITGAVMFVDNRWVPSLFATRKNPPSDEMLDPLCPSICSAVPCYVIDTRLTNCTSLGAPSMNDE